MDNIKKIPYEISLWEDVRKYEVYREIVDENKTTTQQFVIVDKPEIDDTVVSSFYDERQIAIIGSNTMSSPARAVEPYFTQRVNGEIILNFSIYYRYYDEEIGKIVNNPFTNLLCNERKVKVKLQRNKYLEPEWYDFVIKDIQEDSESGTFTYTATGLFVNELSKNGFELVFDAELESGQGTVESLGKAALEGSDWQFDKADIMVEKNIEVLYTITLNKDIECVKTIDKTSTTIPKEETIYVFYNVLAQKSDFFQFMYFGDKPSDEVSNELLDGDGVVIDEENEYSYHIENYTGWIDNSENELNINIPDIAKETKLEPSTIIPRGKRIVRRGLTILDPRIDEYVTIYENDEGKRIYRYSTVKYPTSSIVQNLLVNGTNFSSSAGWESDSASNYVLPTVGEQISDEQFGLSQCYLDFHFNEENGKILNTGIYDNRFQIDEFKAGEEYVLKWERLEHSYDTDINDSFTVVLTGYKINSKTKKYEFISDEELIDECELKETSGQKVVKIKKNLSTNVINSRVGIFFIKRKPTTTTNSEGKDVFDPVKFKEIQFFKKELDADGNIIIPGEPVESKVVTEYRYYDPAKNEDATSIEELVGVTIEPPKGYALAYDEKFNKNRAISVTESNRFNIIQTICETFECWADFKIGHEVNGKVSYIQDWEKVKGKELSIGDCYFTYDKEGNLSEPQFVTAINKEDDSFLEKTCRRRVNKKDKKVEFKQYIGKDNHVGFKYGINLNSIQRNINSDQIVTKIIVKDNSNEYAKNGACSISRADDSPTKENFLFNFDYYIKQGLLSYSEITNDLYLNASQYLNYYNRLRKLNAENQSIIETQAEIRKAILVAESNLTVYQTSREEALKDYNEELADLKQYLKLSATASNEEVITEAKERIELDKDNNETYSDLTAESRLMKVNMLKTKYNNYLKLEQNTRLELGIDEEGNITENPGELEGLKHKELNLSKQFNRNLAEKALLNKKFYEKYSRFIQEGSWISDEYMDDNLYYFDAEGVLYTSSRPQISYTINVLDLSPLEGYEVYSYQIGDKTYIEDTEFFGWKIVDYRKVPAKEEVIVSEYVMYFDNPEQNVITVQNYKTQFEDLYQRITATTNSLQFHSGEYGRAASVVQSDGTIESGALQNSLLTTSYILENAKNQSVVWDDTGITTTNLSNANEIVRITSGAIAISNNGGETWSSAITGYGINANYIAAGSIDVSKVRIMNRNFPSFRWTSTGLDAYSFIADEGGGYINTNFNKFVRFDQHGIYGMQGIDQDWVPNKLSDIINNDNLRFALTWDGLRINNDDGSVQIDDKDDITVTDKNKIQRIKIGRFNKTLNRNQEVVNSDYGIRLRNSNNDITLEAVDDGNLWLREMLYIGNQNDDTGVRIGHNKEKVREGTDINEVFHAGEENSNKEFIVYEDGFMKASGAEFEGTINATGGIIGVLTIEEVFGNNSSAANFLMNADGFWASISNAKLEFNENGLTIKNAGLEIKNNKDESILSMNEETGDLIITGTINANDGYFSGTINAEQGEIGGFLIKKEVEYIEVKSPLKQDLSKYFEKKIEDGTGEEEGGSTITGDSISYIKTSDTEIDESKTYYEEKVKENYLISSDENIKLDGLNGIIKAEEIELGIGAKITNYIELEGPTVKIEEETITYPSAFIYNPATNNGKFIEAGALKIDSNGKIETGTITIDGTTSTINIGNNIIFDGLNKTLSSNSWKITPDKSEFNNVTIKGSIEAASFEYGEVTTVGGILFIKASSAITHVDTNEKTIIINYIKNDQDSKGLFSVNDICCFSTNLSGSSLSNSTIWKIVNVSSNSDSTTLKLENYDNKANNLPENLIGGSIYKIGSLDSNNNLSDNFGIGINSSSNDSFLPKHSLSIVELTKNESNESNESNKFKYNNKLILGDLSTIEETAGYGLYADNVILNGKLVSKNGYNLTAGINSKGQGEMPYNFENCPWKKEEAGKIILWAGSKDPTSAAEANFKVDEKGNLYASSGYFKGAIITDSIIEAAELKTATITGTGKKPSKIYGLTIRNISNGIIFKDEGDNSSSYYFELNNSITDINTPKIKAGVLVIQQGQGTFNGNFSFNDISILSNKISYVKNNIAEDGAINQTNSDLINTYIEFNDKTINCFNKLLIEENYTTINNDIFFNNDEIRYDKGKTSIEIVEKGYDVYVSE